MPQRLLILDVKNRCIFVFLFFVVEIIDLREVICRFSINPCSAEETGAFTFQFTDYFATVNAVVDKWVLLTLAVADLPVLGNLAHITQGQLLDLLSFHLFLSKFARVFVHFASICVIASLGHNFFDESCNKSFDFSLVLVQ